jgi:sulfite reductase alpha subunit
MDGATGDIILLGASTDHLQPCFDDLSEIGFDLGGSGSDMRSPSCCVGPGRCEYACIDTLDLLYSVTMEYQDELHRPMFPYKTKIKISGCPNDCVAAVARSDISVIGTWRDNIRVDADEVAAYAANGLDIQAEVVDMCPTECMRWDVQSVAPGQRAGSHHPGGRQGTHRARCFALLGARALHENGTALR